MTVITLNVNFDYRQLSMVQDLEPAEDTVIFSFLNNGMIYEADIAHLMMRALHDGDVADRIAAAATHQRAVQHDRGCGPAVAG